MSSISDKFAQKNPGTAGAGRRVSLRLAKVGLWSVTKTSFLVGIVIGLLTLLAGVLIWNILEHTGAFLGIQGLVTTGGTASLSSALKPIFAFSTAFAISAVLGVIMVPITVIVAVIGALAYNVAVFLMRGTVMGFARP